jgi:prepilin-type N-terminal cleavage/methylation domain-containing protein
MDVKCKKSGFTIVELLTVLAIITMLVGLLVPALNLVRNIAKETKQKAQLTTIGLALTAFRNDDGDYPPSDWFPRPPRNDYCGAQKLAEALLGWDLLGFHPKSAWMADGSDGLTPQGPRTYDPLKMRDIDGDGVPDTLDERRGRYLELATTNAFRLGVNWNRPDPEGLFPDTIPTPLNPDTFVICDVFGVRRIKIGQKTFTAGTPILYYRAKTSSKTFAPPATPDLRIYNALDNQRLLELGTVTKDGTPGKPHPLAHTVATDYPVFYSDQFNYGTGIGYGIRDPKVTAIPWPYRHDSYILISAGLDGLYGTKDDIRNFGK